MRKADKELSVCPVCNGKSFLNRISRRIFFCADCFNEIEVRGKKVYVLDVDEEGNVQSEKEVIAI